MPFTFRDAERDAELDFESLKEQFKEQKPLMPVVLCDVEGRFVDDDGNPVSAVVATDENYVWAREWGESSPSPYLNRRNILSITGTPCWAGYSDESIEKEILGLFIINPSLTRRQIEDSHAREHEPGGYQPVNVYLRMLVPLRVTPLGGLVVQVAPLLYEYNGLPVIYAGTNSLDLTSNRPTSGLARYTLIYLNPVDNTINTLNGTTVTDSLAFTPPLPTPPSSSYPSAWVRLAGGQTQISEAQDIVDGRMILSKFEEPGDAARVPAATKLYLYHNFV